MVRRGDRVRSALLDEVTNSTVGTIKSMSEGALTIRWDDNTYCVVSEHEVVPLLQVVPTFTLLELSANPPRCPKHSGFDADYCPACGTMPIIPPLHS